MPRKMTKTTVTVQQRFSPPHLPPTDRGDFRLYRVVKLTNRLHPPVGEELTPEQLTAVMENCTDPVTGSVIDWRAARHETSVTIT